VRPRHGGSRPGACRHHRSTGQRPHVGHHRFVDPALLGRHQGGEELRRPTRGIPLVHDRDELQFASLQPCTTYQLDVRAQTRTGTSAWVTTTAKTTGCAVSSVPAAPANVRASDATSTALRLNWDPATGASSYDVHLEGYHSTSSGTSFTFTELAACTTYTLGVRSRSSTGTSPWADITATTAGCTTGVFPDPAPSPAPTPAPAPTPTTGGLRVSGNKLLDASGSPVQLHGVNRSGLEYACIDGWGIFDGPSDDASIAAMRSWNANIVHIGLNEHCILGINGVKPAYGGATYMNAVVDYVNRLHAQGLYAEVSLMWSAPGTQPARSHPPILNQEHSPAALRAIANAFKSDPKTIIGLQSEPHNIGWACWRDGGAACSVGYPALGMQAALDVVRSTGATNPVTVSGIDYANNLSQWPTYRPRDPAGQLMAEAHVYGKNACASVACFDANYAPVAAQVPLVFGETGETYDDSSCGSANISTFLKWADAHASAIRPGSGTHGERAGRSSATTRERPRTPSGRTSSRISRPGRNTSVRSCPGEADAGHQARAPVTASPSGDAVDPALFDRDGLRQVPRLVHVEAAEPCDAVREPLERDDRQDGLEHPVVPGLEDLFRVLGRCPRRPPRDRDDVGAARADLLPVRDDLFEHGRLRRDAHTTASSQSSCEGTCFISAGA
jgi:hypothetical protein